MDKNWIYTTIFKEKPYKLKGFKKNKDYRWVKKDYSKYQSLEIHRSAISRFLLPHINSLGMSVDIESNFNRILKDILSGHVQISNLKGSYSVDSNNYQMDALFLYLEFEFEGKLLWMSAYGWGVDLHKLDIGYGKHAIVKKMKYYYSGKQSFENCVPMTLDELKNIIENQKQSVICEYGKSEPDKEMIEANRESLTKRMLGESLGLSYNYNLDDFE